MANRGNRFHGNRFPGSRQGYDPHQRGFVNSHHMTPGPAAVPHGPHQHQRQFSSQKRPHVTTSAPTTPIRSNAPPRQRNSGEYDSLAALVGELQAAVAEVRGENMFLRLQKDLDDLNQYNRRENVCFTNLRLDNDHDAETQVRNLCHEIGVEVTTDDIIACHPLPSRKGRDVRVICRLKDRRLAHKIFENRKGTKAIGTNKKSELAARPDKGFAVQPNLTPMRAKLLAQV